MSQAVGGTPHSYLLLDLPSELIAKILHFALRRAQVGTLSTLSKDIQIHVYDIVYGIVVLDSVKLIDHFHTTIKADSRALPYIRKLVITDIGEMEGRSDMSSKVSNIISMCTAIQALTLPTLEFMPIGLNWSTHPNLVEIMALDARRDFFSFGRAVAQRNLKLERLRIAEPPTYGPFIRPSVILEEFNSPSQLTHLELSRIANSNQENDAIFIGDIAAILQGQKFPNLQVLVVTVMTTGWASEPPVRETSIWELLEDIRRLDTRIVLIEGQRGAWAKEWKDFDFTLGVGVQSAFWVDYDRPLTRL